MRRSLRGKKTELSWWDRKLRCDVSDQLIILTWWRYAVMLLLLCMFHFEAWRSLWWQWQCGMFYSGETKERNNYLYLLGAVSCVCCLFVWRLFLFSIFNFSFFFFSKQKKIQKNGTIGIIRFSKTIESSWSLEGQGPRSFQFFNFLRRRLSQHVFENEGERVQQNLWRQKSLFVKMKIP